MVLLILYEETKVITKEERMILMVLDKYCSDLAPTEITVTLSLPSPIAYSLLREGYQMGLSVEELAIKLLTYAVEESLEDIQDGYLDTVLAEIGKMRPARQQTFAQWCLSEGLIDDIIDNMRDIEIAAWDMAAQPNLLAGDGLARVEILYSEILAHIKDYMSAIGAEVDANECLSSIRDYMRTQDALERSEHHDSVRYHL
jgi:hypothetical protein